MKKIATDFGLYCVEAGVSSAPPLVLLHAFPLTHAMWAPQIKALSLSHRVIAYDSRGLGGSELGEGQFTLETLADDVIRILDLLGTERVTLCGLSLGGYVALRVVEKYPGRVSALVLCDTRSEADDNDGKLKRAQSISLLQTRGVMDFASGFVPNLLAASSLESRSDLVAELTEMILAQNPRGIVATQFAMLSRGDSTDFLAKIDIPTLVVHGELDGMIPIAQARAMQARIPGSQFVAIPLAGHLSNIEQPEAFNLALSRFLRAR